MREHKPNENEVSYSTKPKQIDLFAPDSEQIKQHHLARLRELREEFINKLKGERKWKK